MSQYYSVKINRKDLYKENYNEKEYKHISCYKQVNISESLIDIFIKMINNKVK